MKKFGLIQLAARGLAYYRNMNLMTLAGAAITAAVITGSLVLGDSISHTLKMLSYARVGDAGWSMSSGERFIRSSLADSMGSELNVTAAPLIILNGTVSAGGGSARVNNVQVTGADSRFFKLSPDGKALEIPEGKALVNRKLAMDLGVDTGDEIILSVRKPSVLPTDSPLSSGSEYAGVRLEVMGIAGSGDFGKFSLKLDSIVKPAVFTGIEPLSKTIDMEGRANAVLIENSGSINDTDVNEALKKVWRIEDAGYTLRDYGREGIVELRAGNVFIPDALARPVMEAYPDARPVLSYFVNSLVKGDRSTPYSVVSSLPRSEDTPGYDEIIINSWLAGDLKAGAGDRIELEYYIINSRRKLEVKKSGFTVKSVIPLDDTPAVRGLMPDIPGLSDEGECRYWDPGIPIDLDKIREKDEQYWYDHRGIPKAFISLERSRAIWGNQFGSLTAIRFYGKNSEDISAGLDGILYPARHGLYFQDIRKLQDQSAKESVDFSQLFIGLNFFLVLSSLILTGLFFAFYAESRSANIRTLRHIGYRKKLIYRLFLSESVVLAAAGAVTGMIMSIAYVQGFLYALGSLWYDAVKIEVPGIYINPATIITSFIISVLFSILSMYISMRSIIGMKETGQGRTKKTHEGLFAPAALIAAVIAAILGYGIFAAGRYPPVLFVICGVLALIEGIIITAINIGKPDKKDVNGGLTADSIGIRNRKRNPGRGLAVTGILAVGVFMVISVASNIKVLPTDVTRRNSGTGGFRLFCTTTHPVDYDLNTVSGRRKAGLTEKLYGNAGFVQMRLREGDNASCLNQKRSYMPQVLGVDPEEFARRNAFRFKGTSGKVLSAMTDAGSGIWRVLDQKLSGGVIPAVADQVVIDWSLGKKLGDTLTLTGEEGETVDIMLTAGLAESVFQGYIIISEKNFLECFPSISGFRVMLVENGEGETEAIRADLSRAFLQHGMDISDTARRLAEFNSVQDSYISIFTVLGGLGLILGSLGLGVLIMRNILQRRGEISLLLAVGYTKGLIIRILMKEYVFLLAAGMITGIISALIAVSPIMISPGSRIPYTLLAGLAALIATAGVISIYYGSRISIKSGSYDELRSE